MSSYLVVFDKDLTKVLLYNGSLPIMPTNCIPPRKADNHFRLITWLVCEGVRLEQPIRLNISYGKKWGISDFETAWYCKVDSSSLVIREYDWTLITETQLEPIQFYLLDSCKQHALGNSICSSLAREFLCTFNDSLEDVRVDVHTYTKHRLPYSNFLAEMRLRKDMLTQDIVGLRCVRSVVGWSKSLSPPVLAYRIWACYGKHSLTPISSYKDLPETNYIIQTALRYMRYFRNDAY